MSKITTVLFDLDGTLLPMDQDNFIKAYFGGLARKLMPYGYDKDTLIGAIWGGTKAMFRNNGEKLNEEAFWEEFCKVFGESAKNDEPIFDEFYANDFCRVQDSCGFDPRAAGAVQTIKSKGFRVALATNPFFPSAATEQRIGWAGVSPHDFEIFTTYENSHYCKPNLDYYIEVISKLGVSPEECLMVGNDVDEDMIAKELGMKVFLLTDCLINKHGKDPSAYPNGGFAELLEYLNKIRKGVE
jgi:FMN phosphatase YigB (HAD superfamily)